MTAGPNPHVQKWPGTATGGRGVKVAIYATSHERGHTVSLASSPLANIPKWESLSPAERQERGNPKPRVSDGRRDQQLLKAAKASGRYGQRDRTLVMLTYRHGLRVSEAVSLRWDPVDLDGGSLPVTRAKNGVPSTHPLRGPNLRYRASAQTRSSSHLRPSQFLTTTSCMRRCFAREMLNKQLELRVTDAEDGRMRARRSSCISRTPIGST